MTSFVRVFSENQIKNVAQLAHTIWYEHYPSIIGIQQVHYMVKKFQSPDAIATQIIEGFQYYVIKYESEPVGYISIKLEDNSLFLSKIYVLSNWRGKGLGKAAFNFIESKASSNNCQSIYMTVNIHNEDSIKAYKKFGYKNVGPVVKDIGGGFVMDDYKMVKDLL